MNKFELKNESEVEKYLRSGEQTAIVPEVHKLVENIEGNTKKQIEEILEIVDSLKKQTFDENDFRKRTASKILIDGYITGCTDAALAYIALARAKKIPTKYIETISNEWLEKGGGKYNGHIYAQSYIAEEKKWTWVDPMMKQVGHEPKGNIIYGEGFDSWDIGIKDFDSLKKTFDKFRENWISLNKK